MLYDAAAIPVTAFTRPHRAFAQWLLRAPDAPAIARCFLPLAYNPGSPPETNAHPRLAGAPLAPISPLARGPGSRAANLFTGMASRKVRAPRNKGGG